jgi:hypothetical protein
MRRRCSPAAAAVAAAVVLCLLHCALAAPAYRGRDINDLITSIVRAFGRYQAYDVTPDYIDTDCSSAWCRQ